MLRRLTALAAGIHELITHRGTPPCDYTGDGRPCLGRRNTGRLVDAGRPERRACRTPSHRRALIAEATGLLVTGTDYPTQR